ncbi:MAG: hypothetical protein GX591_17125 [Planctomycetes bacterium]|nr:hypothetical protein [Planctomycetota bacterium]
MAEGASEQAAAIEETTSSVEEIASMIKQSAGNADEARNLADSACKTAGTGRTTPPEASAPLERESEMAAFQAWLFRRFLPRHRDAHDGVPVPHCRAGVPSGPPGA